MGDLFGNKIAHEITKFSKNSLQNNSETVANKHDKKTPEKDIFLQTKGRNLLII